MDDCAEFRALASSQLDGELDELESARLDRHLVVCAQCATWTREVAALGILLQESTSVPPAWTSEGLPRSLRWRFVHAASVVAASASAAAVAAFVLAQPGSGLSLFSSGSARAASETPCVSCTKKQSLTASRTRSRPVRLRVVTDSVRTHVTNPLLDPED
jgi:hypothetical protein